MALFDDVKQVLRTNMDDEVYDLIEAAKADLQLSGVLSTKIVDTDPLIKRAILVYCKSNFGYEDPVMADRFQESYDMLKTHLTMSIDYTVEVM
jgi:hypothetical protein